MPLFLRQILAGIVISLICLTASAVQPKVFGWVELGLIGPEEVPIKIKMDTGALTSSMDAQDIQSFKKGVAKWVRFNVEFKDAKTDQWTEVSFERPVERSVKLRGAGGSEHRPVVSLELCIGDQRYNEQFTLNNRSKMNYPVLIGRRTLEKLGLVDVSRTFIQPPNCPAT